MKKLILYFLAIVLVISCENQLVNPDNEDLNKFDKVGAPDNIKEGKYASAKKVYKVSKIHCEYTFDPNSPDQDCGGFLNSNGVKFKYESKKERSLRNLEIFFPSKLIVNGEVLKTFSLYTINRHEMLSDKGVLESGHTWGTFKVYKVKDPLIVDKERVIKYDRIAMDPLQDLGPLIISGEFRGVIKGNKTEMNLVGKGFNEFADAQLFAAEDMICSKGMFCWKSKISGKIKKIEYVDE